jgi:hypothetical protein
MADQAVDVGAVAEIEGFVFPAVTGMARRARGPVALDADAEVVDGVLLAVRHRLCAALHRHGVRLPGPVDCVHDLFGGLLVTFEAGLGHFLAGRKRLLEQAAVVYRLGPPRHVVPGAVDDLPRRGRRRPREIPDRDGDQDEDEYQAGDPAVARFLHVGSKSGEPVTGIILASSNLGFHIIDFNAALHDRGQYGRYPVDTSRTRSSQHARHAG